MDGLLTFKRVDHCTGVRAEVMDNALILTSLRRQVARVAEETRIDVRLSVDPGLARLPAELERTCFRVAREALTNVVRHSRATRLEVTLRREPDGITLRVRDNGAGFEVEATRRRSEASGRLGLVGMEERARMAGGR